MYPIKFILSTMLLIFLTLVPFQNVQAKTTDDTNIWVITDIHYLSPSLHDNGEAYQHIKNTGAGKDFDYGAQRMEALIWQIQHAQPDALIISGDLTLNGEYQSMVDLQNYFTQIEQLGTDVYVIPGNHDIASGWARSFTGEDFLHTRQVLPNDFKKLFADFGYREADAVDEDSLSYTVQITPTLRLLMIDSNIYTNDEGVGAPTTKGTIKPTTLTWIQQIFAESHAKNIDVLPVVHHNSITHNERLEKNYTLENANAFQQLLFEYHIPFTLSGHIHTQHYQQLSKDTQTITDIVTGAFSSYPSYIGQLTIHHHQAQYVATPLAFNDWATQTHHSMPENSDFETYMKDTFIDNSARMAYREMIEGGWYTDDNPLLDELAQYVGLINVAFFAGKPLSTFDLSSFEYLSDIQSLIQNNASRFFKAYIQQIENNTIDYTTLSDLTWQ